MKILVINPNSDELTDIKLKEKIDLFINGQYQVDVVHVTSTPKLVGGAYHEFLGAQEMIDFVNNGTEYDAFIVACHGDPNLDLLKKITKKPVVGIAQASMKVASMMGNTFAVISPSLNSYSSKVALVRKYNCEGLYVGSKVTKSNDIKDVLAAGKQAKADFNMDCIVLGCANFVMADKILEKELGIPVIDGLACALFMAVGLVQYQNYKNNI